MMKKSTNKFRKCPNCPHHRPTQPKCCCQRTSTARKNRPMTSRNKRQPSTIDHSSAVNTSIPTIIAEFSALRTQNNHLKRELLNVSAFIKDEPFHTQSNTESSLSQKLFLANKNLKQALLEIDTLSRANKELCDRNSSQSQQIQGLRIQLRQSDDYLERYKKKLRRMTRQNEELASKEQIEKILQHNADLQAQISTLKEQIRCLRFQNQNYNMVGALSTDWVAQTGNKLKKQQPQGTRQQQLLKDDVELWRRSLSQTISLLRNDKSHFSSCSLEYSKIIGLQQLIQQLLESYSQSLLNHFQLLMKEINRKLANYQKKMNNLAGRLQNFLAAFNNKKLKKKLSPLCSLVPTQRLPLTDLNTRLL